jgi:hypothetical protein
MTDESSTKYVLVPVVVSFTEDYMKDIDKQRPGDDSLIRESAVRKLLDGDIDAVGNIEESEKIEDITGAQEINI